MILKLTRTDYTLLSTIGALTLDGEHLCYTLEDRVREDERSVGEWKLNAVTAIPRGEYKVVKTWSNRFKRQMYLLLNVPGFSGIRIHAGNRAENTEGCLLVGVEKGKDVIYQSRKALSLVEKLFDQAITNKEEIIICIE